VADAASQLDPGGARCYARRVLDEVTYDEITDPAGTAFKGDAFQKTLLQAYQACIQASDSSALQSRSGVT
jgi:hypothetical protein